MGLSLKQNPSAWMLQTAVASTSQALNLGSGTSAKTLMCIHPPRAATPSERNATPAHRLRHHTMMIAVVVQGTKMIVQGTMMIAVVVQGLHHVGAGSKMATAVGAMMDTVGGRMLNPHAVPMQAVVEFTSLETSLGSGTFARAFMCIPPPPAASPLRSRTAKWRSCSNHGNGRLRNEQ